MKLRKVFTSVVLVYLFVSVFAVLAMGANLPSGNTTVKAASTSPELPFDPDDYNFMIYDCDGDEDSIQDAMDEIGIMSYTVCNAASPVTLAGLNSHDILIVGWDGGGGDKGGLSASVLGQGITGQIILSGHDSDYHTVNPPDEHPNPDAGEIFFIQEIEYILNGSGTGLIVCADIDNNFNWLPASWGVSSSIVADETKVSLITQAGRDSGIYDGLTPGYLSGWGQSYHNDFTQWGKYFEAFELGNEGQDVVTIGTTINALDLGFEKYDDVNEFDCVGIDDEFTYTICWEAPNNLTLENAYIIDYLPDGVDCNYIDMTIWPPYDPNYSIEERTYTWYLGTIYPSDEGCVTLTVKVNEWSEPGVNLHNIAELVSDGVVWARATEDTLVCCRDDDKGDPNVIYVDKNANGFNNGTNWRDAYTDPYDAFYRASYSECQQDFTIYVAEGVYAFDPNSPNNYEVPDDVKVYGGFMRGGSSFEGRNPYRYETIFTGLMGYNEYGHPIRIGNVIEMGDDTLLDGFTITESDYFAVTNNGGDFTLENCVVKDNQQRGIYALGGNVTVKWCMVIDNGWHGIRHEGNGYTLTVENSQIKRNEQHGIFTDGSIPIVKNSIISSNGSDIFGYYEGINIENPADDPVLYNNTIVYNKIEGIAFVDDEDSDGDPNGRDWPDIQNCIVYFNNASGAQMAGINSDEFAKYSCIQDCNNLNGNINIAPGFAYTIDPNHVMPYPDNYHLAIDSPCIDNGNSDLVTDPNAKDIDREDRIYGSGVDRGADEVYSCDDDLTEDDVYNALDWNADGIVNYSEFDLLAQNYLLRDPNDPAIITDPNFVGDPDYASPDDLQKWSDNWNRYYDFNDDYIVSFGDIAIFLDEWLWVACWRQAEIDMAMAMGGVESMMMPMSMEFAMTEPEPEPEVAELTEEELAGLVTGIHDMMSSLDESYQIGDLKKKEFKELVDFFENVLLDLQEEYLE
jgi:hypothetical protein